MGLDDEAGRDGAERGERDADLVGLEGEHLGVQLWRDFLEAGEQRFVELELQREGARVRFVREARGAVGVAGLDAPWRGGRLRFGPVFGGKGQPYLRGGVVGGVAELLAAGADLAFEIHEAARAGAEFVGGELRAVERARRGLAAAAGEDFDGAGGGRDAQDFAENPLPRLGADGERLGVDRAADLGGVVEDGGQFFVAAPRLGAAVVAAQPALIAHADGVGRDVEVAAAPASARRAGEWGDAEGGGLPVVEVDGEEELAGGLAGLADVGAQPEPVFGPDEFTLVDSERSGRHSRELGQVEGVPEARDLERGGRGAGAHRGQVREDLLPVAIDACMGGGRELVAVGGERGEHGGGLGGGVILGADERVESGPGEVAAFVEQGEDVAAEEIAIGVGGGGQRVGLAEAPGAEGRPVAGTIAEEREEAEQRGVCGEAGAHVPELRADLGGEERAQGFVRREVVVQRVAGEAVVGGGGLLELGDECLPALHHAALLDGDAFHELREIAQREDEADAEHGALAGRGGFGEAGLPGGEGVLRALVPEGLEECGRAVEGVGGAGVGAGEEDARDVFADEPAEGAQVLGVARVVLGACEPLEHGGGMDRGFGGDFGAQRDGERVEVRVEDLVGAHGSFERLEFLRDADPRDHGLPARAQLGVVPVLEAELAFVEVTREDVIREGRAQEVGRGDAADGGAHAQRDELGLARAERPGGFGGGAGGGPEFVAGGPARFLQPVGGFARRAPRGGGLLAAEGAGEFAGEGVEGFGGLVGVAGARELVLHAAAGLARAELEGELAGHVEGLPDAAVDEPAARPEPVRGGAVAFLLRAERVEALAFQHEERGLVREPMDEPEGEGALEITGLRGLADGAEIEHGDGHGAAGLDRELAGEGEELARGGFGPHLRIGEGQELLVAGEHGARPGGDEAGDEDLLVADGFGAEEDQPVGVERLAEAGEALLREQSGEFLHVGGGVGGGDEAEGGLFFDLGGEGLGGIAGAGLAEDGEGGCRGGGKGEREEDGEPAHGRGR